MVQQGDEVPRTAVAQPVHPRAVVTSTAPSTVTLRFVAGGEDPGAGRAAPAGPHMRQQVQVRLVLSQHHRAARQPGHDTRYHLVLSRVAAGGQSRAQQPQD